MKILLINPPIRLWAEPNCFPLGLGYLTSILLAAGHRVEILDINAHRWNQNEVERRIRQVEYDLAGIGGVITTYGYVKWLIQILKKYYPDRKIIVGGPVGSSIPRLMLEKNKIDFICISEGEETLRELTQVLDAHKNLSTVNGIWYRDMNGSIHANPQREPIENLDELPLPAWDYFPMDIYLTNPIGTPNRNKWIDGKPAKITPLSMNLFASRGCPYHCIFCYHDFMGQGYRYRSPENIINEIKILHRNYGVEYFHFIDDEFVGHKKFVGQFCEQMQNLRQELKVNLTWGCTGRVNLMTEELIAGMAAAGCTSIGYGIESGSQRMLDLMKKKVTVEQAKQAVRLTKKYLGWADCSFIIGLPKETKATIRETINFCKGLDLVPEVIFFATPYPQTELYQLAIQRGFITDKERFIMSLGEQGEKIDVNFTDFSDQELREIKESMVFELKAWNRVTHVES